MPRPSFHVVCGALLLAACGRVGFEQRDAPDDADVPDASLVSAIGCADGEREDLLDAGAFPDIAACGAGWTVPGLADPPISCGRLGGDDGPRPTGDGCSAADACAEGWHVCSSDAEVGAATAGRDCSPLIQVDGFYASQVVWRYCVGGVNDDFLGCGKTFGLARDECSGWLDRSNNDGCVGGGGNMPAPWTCTRNSTERLMVTKPGSANGGVICCRS